MLVLAAARAFLLLTSRQWLISSSGWFMSMRCVHVLREKSLVCQMWVKPCVLWWDTWFALTKGEIPTLIVRHQLSYCNTFRWWWASLDKLWKVRIFPYLIGCTINITQTHVCIMSMGCTIAKNEHQILDWQYSVIISSVM